MRSAKNHRESFQTLKRKTYLLLQLDSCLGKQLLWEGTAMEEERDSSALEICAGREKTERKIKT